MKRRYSMEYRKITIIVIQIVLCCGSFLCAQQNWFWQNPWPQGNHLNDVHVFDANKAIVVGDVGTVLKTSDGGMNWEIQHYTSGTSKKLNAVHFVDDDTGWIVGGEGGEYPYANTKSIILKTIDGGMTWDSLSFAVSSELQTIHFANSDTGWAAGTNGIILKTTDGGITWDSLLTHPFNKWSSLFFLDSSTGWVAGTDSTLEHADIMKTTDGGVNWNSVISDTTLPFSAIHFIDLDTGWATSAFCYGDCWGNIYKTTDGGVTWEEVFIDPDELKSIYFIDNETGWAGGGRIFKTTDGGDTWQSLSPYTQGFNSLKFNGSNTGWTVGNYGIIYQSGDGGITWDPQSKIFTDDDIQSVQFLDNDNGWAVSGDKSWFFEGTIYSYRILNTTDGGATWNTVLYGSSEYIDLYLRSIFFADNSSGWAVGHGSRVFHTTDGGSNWNDFSSIFPGEWEDVLFINPDIGWIAGSDILKTVDGGITWNTVTPSLSANSISFFDPDTGWAVGSGSSIWKSTDGGNTWNPHSSGVNQVLQSVYFTDANNGWVVGTNGTILKTNDGGVTWDSLTNTPSNQWRDVYFTDASTGWITGDGTILSTTDGGLNWQSYSAGTNAALNSVYFRDANTGWVVGDDGVILSTINPLVSIDEKDQTTLNIPESVQLYQNYPNPFNPTTTIEFSLPNSSFVTLKIFNILGQEVTTLVSKKLPAGSYKFSWDGNSLASGIYFYRLKTEQGFARTKRMLLLK